MVEIGKCHVAVGFKRLLLMAPRFQIIEALIVYVILLIEPVTLESDTDPATRIVKFVDLVLILTEPGHLSFLHGDRVADLFRTPPVAMERIVPCTFDFPMENFDHG